MGSSRTLREKKRDQVRDHLVEVAIGLFEKKGFDETTVAEIARAADVSPRTFFRYFPHKEALIFGGASSALAVLRGYLRARPPEEGDYEALRGALLDFGTFLEDHKPQTLAAIELMAVSPALAAKRGDEIERWLRDLTEELAKRPVGSRSRLRARLTVSTAFGAFLAGLEEWRLSRDRQPLSKLLRRSFTSLERDVLKHEDDGHL